jgi:hypothetical protein
MFGLGGQEILILAMLGGGFVLLLVLLLRTGREDAPEFRGDEERD